MARKVGSRAGGDKNPREPARNRDALRVNDHGAPVAKDGCPMARRAGPVVTGAGSAPHQKLNVRPRLSAQLCWMPASSMSLKSFAFEGRSQLSDVM
jgi:hypothetical protein